MDQDQGPEGEAGASPCTSREAGAYGALVVTALGYHAERNLASGATDTHLFETQGACRSRVHAKLTSLLC